MKKSLLLLSILSIVLISTSCKKSTTTPSTHSIVGLWIGTAQANTESTSGLYSSYDIRADSTILVQGMGADGNTYYSSGSWSLTGNIFVAQYTTQNFSQNGAVQVATATYDNLTDKLTSGTWKNVGTTATGTFSLDKVN